MRENTSVHRLLRRVLSLCLAVVLAVSLCVPALAAQKNYSANDYVQRLKDSVRGSATVDLDAGKDPNEVVRAMVVTDVPAAVEQAGTVSYTAAVQSAEARTLRSQESVIRQVRRITGSSVINQSGYLVSAFSMDMTRAQMKQVATLDGVVSVSEVTTYKARMTSAKEMTSAMELWKAENGGSTGNNNTDKPGKDNSTKSPQTGDSSNLIGWLAALFVSGGAAIGTTVVSRKKKYNR